MYPAKHQKEIVIVFARAPTPGTCKTRLIPRYGARGAARIHRALVRRTLETACAAGMAVELWCAPDTRHGYFLECRRRHGVRLKRQHAGDLGRRMGLALAHALQRCDAAIIVGTDCAVLEVADLHDARAVLHAHDHVIQPAEDGGYVLIGARRTDPGALRGIAWSSGRELAQTRARLARRGRSCVLLPARWDIDHPGDVRRARRAGLM